MPTIQEALDQAVAYHRAGQLARAEQIYRQVLQVDPRQPNAWHLLGVVEHQAGRHTTAIDYIGRAIALAPAVAAYHNNLGEAYRALRRLDDATACYRRAQELEPDDPQGHVSLGGALIEQGQWVEAEASFR